MKRTAAVPGRVIVHGSASGPILASYQPISFLGGVDPKTGVITQRESPIRGRDITGKILVFPHGRGSTVGSYVLYALAANGHAPAGIVNERPDPVVVVGAIIADVPMMIVDDVGSLAHFQAAEMDCDSGMIYLR